MPNPNNNKQICSNEILTSNTYYIESLDYDEVQLHSRKMVTKPLSIITTKPIDEEQLHNPKNHTQQPTPQHETQHLEAKLPFLEILNQSEPMIQPKFDFL